MTDKVSIAVEPKKVLAAPVFVGKAHRLTKNGSTMNVENSKGHR